MAEIVITKDNFEVEALKSDKPILLDFWATWCGPCRMLAPIIEEIAEEANGRYQVGTINVDEQEELAAAFGISNIPTLIILKNGKIVNQSLGYHPKEQILALLEESI